MSVIERSKLNRLAPCTCGSTAVIDANRHSENCHRRLWRDFTDAYDVQAEQLRGAVEALRVADDLLRRFSISANDHSELIRREFGGAQRQINDALGGQA